MPTVDELNFKLIVDDKDFESSVQKDIQTARQLNTELSSLLNVKRSLTQISKDDVQNATNATRIATAQVKAQEQQRKAIESTNQALRTQQRLDEERVKTQTAVGAERRERELIRTRREQEALNRELSKQNGLLSKGEQLFASFFALDRVVGVAKALIEVSKVFEEQRVTLRAILQDADAADHLFDRIKELAVMSPFAFKDLATYAKQLSAYSIPVENLYDTTKMLADVSAGLGVEMSRLVLAYGQIRSAAFLRGQEVRQLTEAGIPILAELAKRFGEIENRVVSAGEVFDKISKRQVSFEMVEDVFKNMTSEGGKFYKMQEVQASTLKGQISNLKDAYEIMFAEIGENNDALLKGAVKFARGSIENYKEIARALRDLVVAYGAYKAALIMTTVYHQAHKLASLTNINLANSYIKVLGRLTGAQKAYAAVLKMIKGINIYGALASVAVGLIAHFTQAAIAAHKFKKELQDISNTKLREAEDSVTVFNNLKEALENSAKGSYNYRQAISQLNSQYGEYLPNLLTEANALDEIRRNADSATQAIYNKAKANAFERSEAKISEKYADRQSKSLESSIKVLTSTSNKKVSEDAAGEFMKYFRDAILTSDNVADISSVVTEEFAKYFGMQASKVYSSETWASISRIVNDYGNLLRKEKVERDKLNDLLDARFNPSVSGQTYEEYKRLKEINDQYNESLRNLRAAEKTQDQYNEELKQLDIKKLIQMRDLYDELGRPDKAKEFQRQLDALTKVPTGWRGAIMSVLNSADYSKYKNMFKVEDTDTASAYIDDLIKAYKKAKEEQKKFANSKVLSEEAKDAADQMKVIEAIAKALGISLEDLAHKGNSLTNSQRDAKEKVEEEINTVKKIYESYNKLKEQSKYLDDDAIKSALKDTFSGYDDLIDNLGFEKRLLELADSLEKFGDSGEKAAQSLRDSLGANSVSRLLKGVAAIDKYRDAVERWLEKDFNLSGSGIAFDLSKIITDLNTKNLKVDGDLKNLVELFTNAKGNNEAIKAISERFGSEIWTKFLTEGESALNELANKEKEYNKAVAQEKVNDLAKQYVKDAYGTMKLSDWGDKSYGQVKAIRDRIRELFNEVDTKGIPVTEDMKKKADKLGISFETLAELVKGVFTQDENNATTELLKKMKDRVGEISSITDDLADTFDSIGGRAGEAFSQALKDVKAITTSILGNADVLNMMSADAKLIEQGITDAAARKAQLEEDGAWDAMTIYGYIAQVLMTIVNMNVKMFEEVKAFNRELADASLELRKIAAEDALVKGVDSIFGSDSVAAIVNATAAMTEYGRSAKEASDKISGMKLTWMSNGWFGTLQQGDLLPMLEKLGDVYDENGLLNKDTLERALNVYDKRLTNKQKTAIMEAIDDIELYEKALDQLENAVSQMFSGVAGDLASSMIESFVSMGDAVADLEGSFQNLGNTIASSLLQSLLLENVLNQYEDWVKTIFQDFSLTGDTDKLESDLYELNDGLSNSVNGFKDFATAFLTAIDNSLGLAGTANSLSNGIKGITEDTADLLASYINAIRADVAYGRVQRQEISDDVKAILGMLPVAPTLTEYLNQIQANTFNTAENTRDILARLDDVITTEQGSPAFRSVSF